MDSLVSRRNWVDFGGWGGGSMGRRCSAPARVGGVRGGRPRGAHGGLGPFQIFSTGGSAGEAEQWAWWRHMGVRGLCGTGGGGQ